MSLFITFEGGEGCGKSTQAKLLYQRLKRQSITVELVHEPGGTDLGKRVESLLKWAVDIDISPISELLLFNVSRAELNEKFIRLMLKSRVTVICDRYADSTIAYQGYGRGLDFSIVKAANNIATQGLSPDLTILLDIPAEEGMARKKGKRPDRFETEDLSFHQRVREGYLKLAKAEPRRWLVIDALQSKEAIAGIIWQRVSKLIKR